MPNPNKKLPVSLRNTREGKMKRRGIRTIKPKRDVHFKKGVEQKGKRPSGYKPGKSLGPPKRK